MTSRLRIPTSVRSGGQLFVGRGLSQLGILGASAIVARSVPTASYGLYSAAFALGAVIVGGPSTGLPVLILRRTAEGDLNRQTLRTALRKELYLCLVLVGVTAAIGAIVFGGWRGFSTALASGIALSMLSFAVLGAYVQCGHRRFGRAAAADAAAGLLFPVLTILALEVNLGIDGALLAVGAAGGVSAAMCWWRLPVLPGSGSVLRLRDAMGFIGLGSVNAGYGRIDTVALDIVSGGQAVGYYGAAYRLLGPFDLVGSAFATVYFSRLSELGREQRDWQRIRWLGAAVFTTASLALLALMYFLEPSLIRTIYGSRYSNALGPARVLLLSVIPWSLYWPTAGALNASHRERQCAYALIIGISVDVLLIAVAGRKFGATGAAWAWVVAETVTLAGMAFFSRGISTRRVGTDPQEHADSAFLALPSPGTRSVVPKSGEQNAGW